MKLDIFIDIRERINSRALWETIEHLGDINVTDLGTNTLVYGTADIDKTQIVLMTCLTFGNAIATITPSRH